MKILQIFGAVVAIHLLAFIFIFASPGCQSTPNIVPTPDATVPTVGNTSSDGGVAFSTATNQAASDLGTGGAYAPVLTPGRAAPTRPGSPNAAAITPIKSASEDVAPVSTYTVTKGDSLWSIAKKNHLTVSELAKANNLGAGATMQPGKKLIIPGKAPAPVRDLGTTPAAVSAPVAESKPASATHLNSDGVHHTVQPGEKLKTIAKKYGVTSGELASANGITNPANIRVGQVLLIPGYKAVGAKTPAKTAKPAAASTAAADKGAAEAPAADTTPHFEIKAPPAGQDLDAGLKDTTTTEVPTIKVDDGPKADAAPKQ